MTSEDKKRLDVILHPSSGALSLEDKLWISLALETPSAARSRRLEVRDGQLRWALRLLELTDMKGTSPTRRAVRLAADLNKYCASADWRANRHLTELPIKAYGNAQTLHYILALNGGRPIQARQICNIAEGSRSPSR